MICNLINNDCLNSNEYIQKESVDLFFVDPPYYITGKGGNSNNKNDRKSWDNQWVNNEDYYNWVEQWMLLMYHQLKITGSAYVCIDWRHSGVFQLLLEKSGFIIQNRITWKRDKGRGSNFNWKSMHEDIWFVTKSNNYTFNVNDVKIEKEVIAPYRDENGNPKDWWINDDGKKVRLTHQGNLWTEHTIPFWSSKEVRSYAKTKRTPENKYQKHQTQKPLDLVEKCIIASSNENDLIVDYFLGSGTTAVASKKLKRNFIGFDKVSEYIDITKLRLKNEIPFSFDYFFS